MNVAGKLIAESQHILTDISRAAGTLVLNLIKHQLIIRFLYIHSCNPKDAFRNFKSRKHGL